MNLFAHFTEAVTPSRKRTRLVSALALMGCLSLTPPAFAENITLNLKNAELSTLIATVADVTNKNFIIDPRVKAKVTVISKKPMNADEVYQVFLSILQVYGFATVDTGSVIKVVPDVNAKQSGIPNASETAPGQLDELVTRVVPVKNVNAAQLVPILRPLIPQQGHLAAYTPTNVLIISDRAINIERMMEIIEKMDKVSNEEIEIIQLHHASAQDIMRILQTLEQQASQSGQRSPGQEVKLIADERTNSILLSGDINSRMRMRGVIAHLDTPVKSGGNTQVIYLRYANAKDMLSVLTGVSKNLPTDTSGAQGGAPGGAPTGGAPVSNISSGSSSDGKIDILADETTNALVITAPPDAMRQLRGIIDQLDVRRAQVLVEAVIAELNINKESQLGVEWMAGSRDPGAVGIVNLRNLGGVIEGAGTGLTTEGGDKAALLGALGKFPRGGSLGLIGGSNDIAVGALISALAADGNANILSTPSVVTLDNEEAEIRIATTVPFVTGSYTSTSDSGSANPTNPFQTISREDVGIILKLKPQVNEGSAVKLDIEQEVSSLGANQTTQKRSIKTSVIVEDGQILVLGGLVEQQVNADRTKVPLLGDIPLLGSLFRAKSAQNRKNNLMIFLHPKILRDAATNLAVTAGKYDFIRAQQIARRKEGVDLMLNESQPVLPKMEDMIKLPEPFSGESTKADKP